MRFLPNSAADRRAMLERIGAGSIAELFADIPARYHLPPGSLDLPPAASECAIRRKFQAASARNLHAASHRCLLGGGTYHHFIPAAVDYILGRGEFLTAYTPYQPEISQGTLQALFEFQTIVARLLGMEVANASMYDAATAVAEAALMAQRVTRRRRVVVAESVNPRYRAVCRTYLRQQEAPLVTIPCPGYQTDIEQLAEAVDDTTAAVVVQTPDFFGAVHRLEPLRAACDRHKALLVVAFSDATAFALLDPPGAMGADIAVGSGQALGIPMSYGGPHIGLFACKARYLRQMPGRLCGATVDADGRRGFVLTLSTREQHIRRERATSNICSNQGLMALAVTVHCTLLGADGLRRVAIKSAAALQRLLELLPPAVERAPGVHFHETVLTFPDQKIRDALCSRAESEGIFAGIPLERLCPEADRRALLVATTEMVEEEDLIRLARWSAELIG
ncbi:MAG: aminomethyl-transferring glycine dehydrogenase subunit GcvPA [Zetaproteobacteria bacterium]|nr:MAG: aminomethyl-transferring glycine dehydrogenase subunit GcvPA [Zetaproteobacteria bacterium]